jgi:hypothetical protein
MPSTIRNSRALFAAIFTLLLIIAGFYAATVTYAQSGLTIVVDHVDANGWRAHVEGSCPEGYELQTRALEGRWTDDDTGTMIRAHCYRPSDGFECWHVTKWVRNPNYTAPTSTPLPIGAPTATPTPPPPTATPCPDCPVPTATTLPSSTPEGTVETTATSQAPSVTPEVPATTPEVPATTPEVPATTPEVPATTPEVPATTPDTGAGVAPGPCPDNPNGMPVRWVHRDGRDVPICEETSGGSAPTPAATVSGYCFVRDNTAMARFDVNLVVGEVARAEYVFSDGTSQLVLDAPFSPDEERPPLPSPLEVVVPAGQTVTLNLTVVGYDDHITVSSNAVDGTCAMLPPPGAPSNDGGGQVVGDVVSGPAGGAPGAPEAIGASGDQLGQADQGGSGLPVGRAVATDVEAAPVIPRALPRTAGEGEYPSLWLLGAVLLLVGGLVVRLRAAHR